MLAYYILKYSLRFPHQRLFQQPVVTEACFNFLHALSGVDVGIKLKMAFYHKMVEISVILLEMPPKNAANINSRRRGSLKRVK